MRTKLGSFAFYCYGFINLIPIIFFIGLVIIFTQNLIAFDDYEIIVKMLLDAIEADGLFEKLKVAFTRKNEYLLPFSLLISGSQYLSVGKLYLNVYPYIGTIPTFIFAYVLYKVYYKGENRNRFFAISFFLFPLHTYLIVTWPIASIQYICAINFSLIAIYFLLQKSNKSFVIAQIFAVLGVFSFGSGLLVLPIGGFILLYKKNFRKLIFWSFFSLILVILYFHGFQGQPVEQSRLAMFLNDPSYVTKGLLYLAGGWFDVIVSSHVIWDKYLILIGGGFTLVLLAYNSLKIIKKYFSKYTLSLKEEYTFFALATLFCVILLIAIGRSGLEPEINGKVSNHRYYNSIILGILYLNFSKYLSKTSFVFLFAGIVLFYSFSVRKYLDAANNWSKVTAANSFNHYTDAQTPNKLTAQFQEMDAELKKLNIYVFPEIEIHKLMNSFKHNEVKQEINSNPIDMERYNEYLIFEKKEEVYSFHTYGEYILLKSDSDLFSIPFYKNIPNGINPISRRTDITASVNTNQIKNGNYDVFLLKHSRSGSYFQSQNKKITIDNTYNQHENS